MPNFVGTTELISLFLFVLLIYVIQCIYWVTPRSIVFTLGLRGQGERKRQGYVWSALETAGVLANPLPPLTPLVAAQWPTFELTPDGILFPGKDGEAVSIPWEELKVSHSESRLKCNGSVVFKGSEFQVLEYVELFRNLQRAQRARRAEVIQDWQRRMMTIQAASRRVRVFTGRSFWLRILTNLQFFSLFVMLPLGFYFFGVLIWWRALLIVLVFSIAITMEFWTLHKLLIPGAKEHRFKTAAITVLSPMAAIRACDVVARDLLGGYHPLAVAGAILPEEEFRRFAGEQLRLVRFGDYLDKQYQAGLQKVMEQAIKKNKLNLQELLRAPEPESGCVVYCPRCLAQYNKIREECADCGFEKLEAFGQKSGVRSQKQGEFAN
jgi:ribosomal protein L37E